MPKKKGKYEQTNKQHEENKYPPPPKNQSNQKNKQIKHNQFYIIHQASLRLRVILF